MIAAHQVSLGSLRFYMKDLKKLSGCRSVPVNRERINTRP